MRYCEGGGAFIVWDDGGPCSFCGSRVRVTREGYRFRHRAAAPAQEGD